MGSGSGTIEICLSKAFLDKAGKCVAFMQENGVDKVTIWCAFGYKLYQDVETADEAEVSGKEVVKVGDNEYVEFEPEYRLDGCHAQIDKDGEIRATLPFKHTSDTMWCTVGDLKDLQRKFAPTAAVAET